MYRDILEKLVDWKEKENRNILLLSGQKAVGKTYLLGDFGEGCFDYSVIVDLKTQEYIRDILDGDVDKQRLVSILEMTGGGEMHPGNSLVAFENIDTLKNMEKTIEFLSKEMTEYHIVVTMECKNGENSGITSANLDVLHLYPLSFKEVLDVTGHEDFVKKIENSSKVKLSDEDNAYLWDCIKLYLYMGGMPSVVQTYMDTGSISAVENEKKRLVESIESDIQSIHDKPLSDKVMQVWKSIPMQLSKDNKKFQFGSVKITARAREYGEAVEWLYNKKYMDKVYRVKDPVNPLKSARDDKSYEVFLTDIGLLSTMFGLSYEDIRTAEKIEELVGGALLEQFVYQEFNTNENIKELYYWISDATARIEIVFEYGGDIIPVEVNLTENTKAQSIKVYKQRYNPDMYISITKDNMYMEQGALKLPLYALWGL